MNNKTSEFLERISASNAPTFLFLGQNTLRHDSSRDVFLDAILQKYELPTPSLIKDGYSNLFYTSIKNDREAARAWISERASILTPPMWIEKTAEFAWSGIFTSSIDGCLNNAFRKEWRTVQPIYSSNLNPSDPRSRAKLHITYLYGAIDRNEVKQTAPISVFELKQREPEAAILMQRLPEQLTPVGTLIIEAYDHQRDWVTADKLYALLMKLERGQAYIFSAPENIKEDEFIAEAINEGRLITFSESLVSVLLQGYEAGIIPTGDSLGIGPTGHQLSLKNKPIAIPEQFWTQITRYGIILDDGFSLKTASISPEKKYALFRNFLAESGTQPLWSAHLQNIPFERNFEREAFLKVKSNLNNRDIDSDPIIIHGQTGAGKTIALANIALRVHLEKRNPVIFIARRTQRFNYADIDGFCQWAESQGFEATLVVWDGMESVEQYYILQKYLIGRGRKFSIIGSTYKLSSNDSSTPNFILAKSLINVNSSPLFEKTELDRFKEYLSIFEPTLGQKLDNLIREGDPNFLVALYRLLPETRGQVRSGLHLESGAAAIILRNNSDSIRPEATETNILQLALEKAGLLQQKKVLSEDKKMMGGELISAEQEFIGLIMVPARFGLQVPIEILLRAVSSGVVSDFSKIIDGIDLFRWTEDNSNNITIGARHSLEAKLICQARLGGPQHEMEYAIKLLKNVRRSQDTFDSNEVQFASEFIRSLGSNGPEGKAYLRQYIELADTLHEIREENGVLSPRLMLQEAALLREAIVLDLIAQHDFETRTGVLKRAVTVLELAISETRNNSRAAKLKSMLLVELASTHGAMARERIRENRPIEEILSEFELAKSAAMSARTLMPEDFFPIDVIAWSTKDLLSYADLPGETRLEIIASIFNTFALAEGDEISRRDREILEKRRAEFATLLKDDKLLDESLAKLEALGSGAGTYLRAVTLAGGLPLASGPVIKKEISGYTNAVDFLFEKFDTVKSDSKCLYLYLRYWWTLNTNLPFYPEERTTIPLASEKWRHLLDILENLIALDGNYENPSILYLQAIAKWQLGYYDPAASVWRELQQISDRVTGKRRITKTYLASSPAGQPIKYNGTVSSVSDDGSKGEIFVEGLRLKLTFFPKDFGREDIRRDEEVSGFHIAFNYIAPTADPARHFKEMHRGDM